MKHRDLISQDNSFHAFLCLGRCKNLGSLNFFLRHPSNLNKGQLVQSIVYLIFHSEFLQNVVSFSNQEVTTSPNRALPVSNAIYLWDPNSSEAIVGISEQLRVCVLRCDVFELFGVGVQDEQALN